MRAIIDDIWQIVTIIIIISGFITNSFLLVMLGVIIPTSVISAKWWAKISLNEIAYRSTFVFSAPENFIKNTFAITKNHF